MLKIGGANSAERGDRWRQRSQETHEQSSHTSNIARFELFSTPSLLTLVFILTLTQLYAILPRTAGFTGARLVFVVIVTLNKPRTSGRR